MKTGTLLCAAAVLGLAASASASIITTNITTQQMIDLIDRESFVAEGRIGNNAMSGTHERALGPDTGDSSMLETAQFVWGNQSPYDWTITVTSDSVTFELGGVVLINDTLGPHTHLFLRTRAAEDSSSLLNNLELNGQSIAGQSFAEGVGARTMTYSGFNHRRSMANLS